MKNKKGFTLIELLAIIVILAIIAVITVPIILDIIENSKKGAIEDSAYGYKESIEKYYTSELFDNNDIKLEDDYIIENGMMTGKNMNSVEIPINGTKPTRGILTYENNKLKRGCLQIDEYAVTFEENRVTKVEKGECEITTDLFEETFEYTGTEAEYTIPKTGYYKIEVWGAQGGNGGDNVDSGGYGGYSTAIVQLTANTKIYVNVGGKGQTNAGGYNGGGAGTRIAGKISNAGGGGGGATHIGTKTGLLSSFDSNENGIADSNELTDLLIVAGGGGGGTETGNRRGGSGGGMNGNAGEGAYYAAGGGTQSTGGTAGDTDSFAGSFGLGGAAADGSAASGTYGVGGGGGGFYGGGGSSHKSNGGELSASSGAGGSGYIGNNSLINGIMYCYNCTESTDSSTKTVSTTGENTLIDSVNCSNGFSDEPISKCAKAENGYAIVKYLGTRI